MVQAKCLGWRCGVSCLAIVLVVASCGGSGGDGPDYSTAHPRIYLDRNRDRLAAALTAKRPAAIRFKDLVDRWVGGDAVYGFAPWYAALIGQLTGDAKYCAKAVTATDAQIKSEEALIGAGKVPAVAGDSYLEIGELVGSAMLVYDWCYPATSSSQRSRWLKYAEQSVWNVWHPEQAKWNGKVVKWSGWSVDNPSNNYYYSFLRATMMLGLAANGESGKEDWRAFFRDTKILGQLVPTFDKDLVGGGSREGTGYGVSMHRLWELYDFWQGSTGEDLASKAGHAQASMLTFMHQVVPTLDRIAPTGDHARDSTAVLFDYHRSYLLALAHLFPQDPVAPQALYLVNNSSVPRMSILFMFVYDFLYDSDLTAAPLEPLGLAHYAPGIGELYARSDWSKSATWINLIGGPYTESHAHQDQGSLLFYKDEWLAYDPNIDSTSGLAQDVDVHNLIRFVKAGVTVPQRNGTSIVQALHRGVGWLHAAVDTKPVYGDAAVQKVEREIVFIEPSCVVVFDRATSAAGTSQVWQLSSPIKPSLSASGDVATFAGKLHTLQVRRVLPADAAASVFSWTGNPDFSNGFRLDQTVARGGAQRFLHVISTDDTVISATLNSSEDARLGVRIEFKDGRSATVQFGIAGVDGNLRITEAGTEKVNETFLPGIDELPVYR
jgi:hypothetical protein